MVGIIINIIAIIICAVTCIIAGYQGNTKMILLSLILVFFNGGLLAINVRKAQEKKDEMVTVIQDIKGYKVDSTIIINGVDTTKTYTITYWKEE